jgi:cell division septation protein DedD
MKKGILLLLLLGSFFAQGQSLKEALFSGKLKNEPGTVIRKGEDLSTKIDTSTRRATANAVATNTDSVRGNATAVVANNGSVTTQATQTNSTPASTNNTTATSSATTGSDATVKSETAASAETTPAESNPTGDATPAAAEVKPKDNTALFKEYMATFRSSLESDVIPNKKLKKGSYYVQLTYVIGTDGQTTITDVYVDPENKFLQQQIADRLNAEMPRLNPVLQSNGTARKQTKRYNFTLEKQ